MKIMKRLSIFLIAALAMFLSACDKQNIGAIYTPTSQNISFDTKELSDAFFTNVDTIDVAIPLYRSLTSNEFSLSYVFSDIDNSGCFTDVTGGNLTFAKGETCAHIKIHGQNLVKGVKYPLSITLDSLAVATADTLITSVPAIKFYVFCDYTWTAYEKTITFWDFIWSENEDGDKASGIKVEYAAEDPTLLRMLSPMKKVYPEEGFGEAYFQFILNTDGSVGFPDGPQDLLPGTPYKFYWMNTGGYAGYCTVALTSAGYYDVNHLLVAGSSLYLGEFLFKFDD